MHLNEIERSNIDRTVVAMHPGATGFLVRDHIQPGAAILFTCAHVSRGEGIASVASQFHRFDIAPHFPSLADGESDISIIRLPLGLVQTGLLPFSTSDLFSGEVGTVPAAGVGWPNLAGVRLGDPPREPPSYAFGTLNSRRWRVTSPDGVRCGLIVDIDLSHGNSGSPIFARVASSLRILGMYTSALGSFNGGTDAKMAAHGVDLVATLDRLRTL